MKEKQMSSVNGEKFGAVNQKVNKNIRKRSTANSSPSHHSWRVSENGENRRQLQTISISEVPESVWIN